MSAPPDDLNSALTIRGFAAEQRLFGRYLLRRQLGRGGMGVVWLAHDEELELDVALKFLPEIVLNDQAALDDLRRETRRSRELTHPHIVRIHDFMRDASAAAISMEFVDGDTLSNLRIKQPNRVFEPAELAPWLGHACEALDYAHHRAKVVHRDLKPSNLMVNGRGDLKLADFGISSSVSETVTRVSARLSSSGTPVYMSPQQMMGEAPAVSDDLYALGATIYELITGKPPFFSGNIVLQVQSRTPPSLAERRGELGIEGAPIPPEWEEAVAACLAKEPGDRPRGTADLARRLGLPGAFARMETAAEEPPPVDELSDAATVIRRTPLANDLGNAETIVGMRPAPPPPPPTARKSAPPAAAATRGVAPKSASAPPPPAKTAPPKRQAPPPPPREEVEPSPAPAPVPVAPRKSSPVKWVVLALLALAALGAGLWFGDVPNRIAAANSNKRGLAARLQSDWATAFKELQGAVKARPSDLALQQDLERAQREWLAQLQRRVEHDDPLEAWREVKRESEGTGMLLWEPFGGSDFWNFVYEQEQSAKAAAEAAVAKIQALAREARFDDARAALQMLRVNEAPATDLAAVAAQVNEAEVRHAIGRALAQAKQGDYRAANATLDAAAGKNILAGEIASARERVRAQAELASIDRLADALQSRRTGEVQSILAEYSSTTGRQFRTTAGDLVNERSLPRFLAALEEVGLKRNDGGERTELVLVEALRDRFTDRDAVKRYLADNYNAWAAELLAAGRPGSALYALGRARAEGATIDADVETQALQKVQEQLALRVVMAATTAENAPDARALTTPVRTALREVLEKAVGSWMRIADTAAGGRPASTITLASAVGGIQQDDRPDTKRETWKYQSGMQRKRNPEHARISSELATARAQYADAQRTQQQAQEAINRGNDRSTVVAGGVLGILNIGRLESMRSKVQQLEAQLRGTPEQIEEPEYKFTTYETITHNLTYRSSASATLETAGQKLTPIAWTASKEHRVSEVKGDASLGVPVKPAVYPVGRDVAADLSATFTAEIRKSAPTVLAQLATASTAAVETVISTSSLPLPAAADLRWGLVELWRRSGANVRLPEPEYEADLRGHLGLPARTPVIGASR